MSLERAGGSFTTDRELVVRSWDDWMAAATGIPAGAATGRPLAELFPEIETRGLLARLKRVADEGNVEVLAPSFHRYLVPCQPRQPSPYFARMQQYVTLSPLRAGGEVAGVVVAIEDVTARRDEERRLAAQLRTGDEPARVRAAEALSRAEGSAEVLMGAFGDSSWRVRQLAVEGVARDPGEEVAAALTRALREQHRDLAVLNSTLSTLARSGADVLPRMLELLKDPDADLRTYVALGLGLLGDPLAIPALVGALEDDDPNVRFHAIEALARLRARAAAPAVAAVAATRDFFLAFAALDALAAIGDPAVAPLLL
ncbi:MAG TPA: HEAT repeat domain-containing protein, partial [Longimicrobium sp.]|nr:HEAT repeat domain-containing protein [Longimicrobium sp.]